MIICFRCDRSTKYELDNLIDSGGYTDYSEAISVAINNLYLLQGRLAASDSIVLDRESGPDRRSRPTAEKRGPTPSPTLRVPKLFALPAVETPPCTAPFPTDPFSNGDPVPLERWVFGQYNRLLPVKVTCRALANLLLEHTHGLAPEDAAARIVESAAQLGDSLKLHDSRFGLHRDEALSTAFPNSGNRAEKSRLRFRGQFVASTTGGGDLVGLPADLKLVNYVGQSRERVALTGAGWDFALLQNPVLDGEQQTPSQKLSPQEQEVLLAHISRQVPVENFTYRTILGAVNLGASTPTDLDAALRSYVSPESAGHVTSSFVSTQRSGALSRMADTGLIERVRNGVRVSYIITDRATIYLRAEPAPGGEGSAGERND